jgi:hypothetical protein
VRDVTSTNLGAGLNLQRILISREKVDTLLASCVILLLRDVISGSGDWESTIDYAIRLVAKRGGPQAVLNSDKSNFTRRFLLENLATHDIFSSSLGWLYLLQKKT